MEEECVLCYNLKILQLKSKYKCNIHCFCDDCFNSWSKNNKSCPLCRAKEICPVMNVRLRTNFQYPRIIMEEPEEDEDDGIEEVEEIIGLSTPI